MATSPINHMSQNCVSATKRIINIKQIDWNKSTLEISGGLVMAFVNKLLLMTFLRSFARHTNSLFFN
jgi:hypothetical protein